MTENKEMEGRLSAFTVEKSGQKKDGTTWTFYKYKIQTKEGERTVSGFKDPQPFLNKYVLVTYQEQPNPKSPFPFKNLINIIEGVSPEEVKETDEKYNVKPVGMSPAQLHDRKQDEILFGQTANLASAWALAHLGQSDEGRDKGKLDYWFDKIHTYLKQKRKELLNL